MSTTIWTKAIGRRPPNAPSKPRLGSCVVFPLHPAGQADRRRSWRRLRDIAGMAGVLSLFSSIASDAATGGSGPSITNAEILTDGKR